MPESIVRHMPTGDYSVDVGGQSLEAGVVVERKTLADLVGCCSGTDRERFMKELGRMALTKRAIVVVEASWEEVHLAQWRSKISANAVAGTVIAWQQRFVPFFFAGNREEAQTFAEWHLIRAAIDFVELRERKQAQPVGAAAAH